ncbi:hypothetical protein BBK36DRAFT_1155567 [Trichoderma citrinoviride]|uniref:Transmembrane protein n=1 Tax=Trichoderma citrinoviride TaxID=58853 RepID=A0A2T4BNC0_9HYPO|nr:hypothetical protein BBK36DRAFT_1155567 [Trichoderma citrinoviride]PTB70781.1 hypothetical protein BBK36DRAFT_1155567 [Trichoderma citrinoviride]
MPIAHHVVLASGAVVAVSVAVATFIAIYESPELRQYADDVRRRIAMAFYSIGDGITPPAREPRFNRPEDADGFFESRRGLGAEPGVDADDETRRRQREELLYWNSVRLQQQQDKEKQQQPQNSSEAPPRPDKLPRRGSTFDDFLRPDDTAEQGAYVFNSGADVRDFGGLRRRGEGARGFMSPAYSNPFADEHHLDADEIQDAHIAHQLGPEPSEMSDIYSATTRDDHEERSATLEAISPSPLVDVTPLPSAGSQSPPPTLERELAEDEFMSAGQPDRQDVHATIQAWAQESSRDFYSPTQDSSRDFYSPLPVTPVAPMSEPDVISEGELTPTDSVSLVGSGEDIANDAQISERDSNGRYMDVMSESEGMLTPASWSEVGSVISDNEGPMHA